MAKDSRRAAKASRAPAASSRSGETLHSRESRAATEASLARANEPLRLVHHHPGYLRIRAAAFLEAPADSPLVTAARTAAETMPGFRSWSSNPRTGSVVIRYEPGAVEADDLLQHIARCAGFRGVTIATRTTVDRRELVRGFLDDVQQLNRTVAELTAERADLRELVPVALIAISAVSFIVNDPRSRLPHWFGALYRSYRVFMHWHRPEVRSREKIARQADERRGFENKDAESR